MVWGLAAIFASMFLLTAANIIYTNQQAHKFCSLMTTLDQAYNVPGQQPRSEYGKRVAADVHDLRKSLGCKEKK